MVGQSAVLPGGGPEGLPRLAYTMRETAGILGVSYITVYRLAADKLSLRDAAA